MTNKKQLLSDFLNGRITREELREELASKAPIIVFTGDPEPDNPYNLPVIRFCDTSTRD